MKKKRRRTWRNTGNNKGTKRGDGSVKIYICFYFGRYPQCYYGCGKQLRTCIERMKNAG